MDDLNNRNIKIVDSVENINQLLKKNLLPNEPAKIFNSDVLIL